MCFSQSRAYDWYKSFKEGQVRVEYESDASYLRISTSEDNLTDVDQLILDNLRIIVREIAEKL